MWSALQALLIYALFAGMQGSLWSVSQNGYYNYLADAFLHGQLHLRIVPPITHDLSVYQGRYYLYWPPFPAILMMPFVALFGVSFSDTLLNLAIGALNVAMVAILLRQASIHRVIKLSRVRRGLLVMCFALGTVHLTLAPFGRVWNTGQLIGFLCVALCYITVLRFRGYASIRFGWFGTCGSFADTQPSGLRGSMAGLLSALSASFTWLAPPGGQYNNRYIADCCGSLAAWRLQLASFPKCVGQWFRLPSYGAALRQRLCDIWRFQPSLSPGKYILSIYRLSAAIS